MVHDIRRKHVSNSPASMLLDIQIEGTCNELLVYFALHAPTFIEGVRRDGGGAMRGASASKGKGQGGARRAVVKPSGGKRQIRPPGPSSLLATPMSSSERGDDPMGEC